MHRERGAALAITIVTALLMAISIYAILVMASSQARQAAFNLSSIQARYAAEIGLVWAQQQLRADSTYCAGAGATGDPDPPVTNGMAIDVVMTGCGTPTPKITVEVDH